MPFWFEAKRVLVKHLSDLEWATDRKGRRCAWRTSGQWSIAFKISTSLVAVYVVGDEVSYNIKLSNLGVLDQLLTELNQLNFFSA